MRTIIAEVLLILITVVVAGIFAQSVIYETNILIKQTNEQITHFGTIDIKEAEYSHGKLILYIVASVDTEINGIKLVNEETGEKIIKEVTPEITIEKGKLVRVEIKISIPRGTWKIELISPYLGTVSSKYTIKV